MKKKCSRCKVIKSLDLFYNNKNAKDSKQAYCKKCQNENTKRYRQSDKGRGYMKEYMKKYRQTDKGRDRILNASEKYCNSTKGQKQSQKYRSSENGKVVIHKSQKKYRETEKGKTTLAKYRSSEKGRAIQEEYMKCQRENHTQVAIRQLLRVQVCAALMKYTKTGKIMSSKECGIDYKAIIKYLGLHPNILGIKGEFHIDHIYPLSRFDLNNPEHIKVVFDSLNHQWLTAEENLKKGNKIPKQCDIPDTLSKRFDRIGLKL